MQSIIETLIDKLNAKFADSPYTFSVKYGKSYAKVISSFHGSQSAYMFISLDSNHAVYKAASWNAPAKGIRYFMRNNDELETLVKLADPYTRFLYAR